MPSGLIFQLFLKERPTFSVFVLSEQTKQSLDEAPDRADSRPNEESLHDAAARSAQIKIMYAERAEKYSEQRREIPILFAAFTGFFVAHHRIHRFSEKIGDRSGLRVVLRGHGCPAMRARRHSAL